MKQGSPVQNDDVGVRRLLRQRLWGGQADSAGTVARYLGAVQAQEFTYARWSLGQRIEASTASRVDADFAEGLFLRTHVLRPTWHFVHRSDADWLLRLTGNRVKRSMQQLTRQLGLDEEALAAGAGVIERAVADGSHCLRHQLAESLRLSNLPSTGPSLSAFLMWAELERVIISGAPVIGSSGTAKQTYAAFASRAAPSTMGGGDGGAFDRAAALREVVIRYFGSRAPSTVKDCALWSGLTLGDIREGLKNAEGLFSFEEIDGSTFVAPVEPFPAAPPGLPRVDLIQCYDEFVMGYTPTRFFNAPPLGINPARLPGHIVLLDGEVAGGWKHVMGRSSAAVPARITVSVDTRVPFTAAQSDALDDAVQRYGRFLERPVELQLPD